MQKSHISILKILPLVAMVLMAFGARAQQPQIKVRYAIIIDGDTLPLYKLEEVKVVESWSLLTKAEIKKNQKLIRNVKKMLPYAKLAKQRLDLLEKQAAGLSPKKRKEVIKQTEKEVLAEFSDELKKFTFSQGKVLLKLVDRETGSTSYVLVNELRGKLRASFYQTFAKIFGYNLKAHYDPKNNKEDNLIERIVLSVENGKL